DQICDALKHQLAADQNMHHSSLQCPLHLPQALPDIERLTEWPIYRADNIVRRAPALQETVINDAPAARLSVALANRLQLSADSCVLIKQEGGEALLMVELCDDMPDNTVYIPAGFGLMADLAAPFGALTLERSDN
ncbi:MAG: hypothetical protein K2Q14_03970, partial [Gammaproteobacteria bacterium]|nr:hypothetical protein [Gammaproteobacteria bacterium]